MQLCGTAETQHRLDTTRNISSAVSAWPSTKPHEAAQSLSSDPQFLHLRHRRGRSPYTAAPTDTLFFSLILAQQPPQWVRASSFLRFIQDVTGGTDQTSGECSLGQTIPI